MQVVSVNVKPEKPSALQQRSNLPSLYTNPPQEELSLDEFELLAVDRLELLRAIEALKIRGAEDKDLNSKVIELEKKHLTGKKDTHSRFSNERRDQISHFILRLAYCRSEELRKWFLNHECTLLKCRLEYLSDSEREQFMRNNGLQYDSVSLEERLRLAPKLAGLAGIAGPSVTGTSYFKVPFHQALLLLSTRQVYLEAGMVYVPLSKLVTILVAQFRAMLSRALAEAAKMFDVVEVDARIAPFLQNVNKQFIGNDFGNRSGGQSDRLTADQVEAAAETNMPLCMKNLHFALKRDHKLKHWGRLQYGLFLKGAGLSMEDAMAFWERHFTKVVSHDEFLKHYSYSFRHMYGKEGARKNYTPYSCMKIIMGAPPEAGAFHGCPYRHANDRQLEAMLAGMKLGNHDVTDILTLAKSGNYQLACQKQFDVMHPGHTSMDIKNSDGAANHPNQWFLASAAYFRAKNGGGSAAAPQGSASVVAPGSGNLEAAAAPAVEESKEAMEEA